MRKLARVATKDIVGYRQSGPAVAGPCDLLRKGTVPETEPPLLSWCSDRPSTPRPKSLEGFVVTGFAWFKNGDSESWRMPGDLVSARGAHRQARIPRQRTQARYTSGISRLAATQAREHRTAETKGRGGLVAQQKEQKVSRKAPWCREMRFRRRMSERSREKARCAVYSSGGLNGTPWTCPLVMQSTLSGVRQAAR